MLEVGVLIRACGDFEGLDVDMQSESEENLI